uniref:Integrator complex subunit 5 C-terminal domain-containing protein n=1 Tax=Parascaris univalens TaxID=6257 RepID=A0A915A864_PARUN
EVSPQCKQFCDGMKDGAIELVNAIISTIISSVHRQALFSKAEKGALGRCIIDSRKLNEYIVGAMSAGERGKFGVRLLYAFCILAGPMKTSEVIVRFILDAEDKPQLNALCTLLVALAPIMPTAAEDAIRDFVSLKDIIEHERKNKSAGNRLSEGLMSEASGAHSAANVT